MCCSEAVLDQRASRLEFACFGSSRELDYVQAMGAVALAQENGLLCRSY